MFSTIEPYQYVAIRLPSDTIRVEQITPNTTINLGKFGSFHANSVIGRPYFLTFEIVEKAKQSDGQQLRVVTAAEIHADALLEEAESDLQDGSPAGTNPDSDEYGLPSTEKSNVAIFDNPEVQKMTMAEIEAMKADGTGDAKELIARILASHSQLDQKTAFSLAKYTLRKQKKYLKRFAVLPLDVATLADWIMNEKDFGKVMEIRNETLSLISSWANIRAASTQGSSHDEGAKIRPESRYLVVDDTGGLVVAALAERLGVLHHTRPSAAMPQSEEEEEHAVEHMSKTQDDSAGAETKDDNILQQSAPSYHRKQNHQSSLATSNTLTLVHSNQQPNLNLLRYFNFDANIPPPPSTSDSNYHPLYAHLKTLTWLQLLDPKSDTTYVEPPVKSADELRSMKSNTRVTYYRKRRRWSRYRQIIDETRAGGFNGLIVASFTSPLSILRHLVPLLAGGAQIVVYAPHVETLLPLVDAYSTARRTAYLTRPAIDEENEDEDDDDNSSSEIHSGIDINIDPNHAKVPEIEDSSREKLLYNNKNNSDNNDDSNYSSNDITAIAEFPVDPTLTLGFTVQTARIKKWQVLPGRTHPLMMGRGGAEGYIASATRVLPVKGRVEARGNHVRSNKAKAKSKKEEEQSTTTAAATSTVTAAQALKKGRILNEANDLVNDAHDAPDDADAADGNGDSSEEVEILADKNRRKRLKS